MQNLNLFFVKGNRPVIIFLLKFFGSYIVLFLLYSFYLEKAQKTVETYTCAPITKTVASQTKAILTFVGYNIEVEQHTEEVSMKLLIDGQLVVRIIEGCNSISVIILFVAFVIAFANGFKRTLLFILFGSLLIYSVNIFRIAVISIAIHKFPQYQTFLHEIVFPGLIYGITVLLWILWVRKFSNLKK